MRAVLGLTATCIPPQLAQAVVQIGAWVCAAPLLVWLLALCVNDHSAARRTIAAYCTRLVDAFLVMGRWALIPTPGHFVTDVGMRILVRRS
jgi:hypothetical protein